MKSLVIVQYTGKKISFNEQGWFNASQTANQFNRSIHEWIRLPDTQNYLAALKRKYERVPYLRTKGENYRDIWLHPKLAVRFAQWLDLDFALWCDEQIDYILCGNHPKFDHHRLRFQAAATYKAISVVLQLSRQHQGKETKPHHYMNEAKLINWAVTGHFSGIDHDTLSYDELDLLVKLQAQNLILISFQYTFTQRKTALYRFAQDVRENRPTLNYRPDLQEH